MRVQIYSVISLALLAVATCHHASRRCPAVDEPFKVVHLANPHNCGTFYKCSGGEAHLQFCPNGLEWSREHEWCDWPERANCHVWGTSQDEAAEEESAEEAAEEAEAVTECPAVDEPFKVVHLANPQNCGTFYKCLEGKAHLQFCPSGLEWSREHEWCDWPDRANCHVTATSKVEQAEEKVETKFNTVVGCPAVDEPFKVVHLGNPYDCTTFFKCFNGQAYLQFCPSGLRWDNIRDICDWPQNAVCASVGR